MEKEYVTALTLDQTNLTELVLLKSNPSNHVGDDSTETSVLLLTDAFELSECGELETRVLVEEESLDETGCGERLKSEYSSDTNGIGGISPVTRLEDNHGQCDDKTAIWPPDDCKRVTTAKRKLLFCQFEGCNRSFLWRTHLQYHSLTHTGSRQYKCPFKNCPKQRRSFYTQQRLDVHLRSHTGERPFVCLECDRSFTTAGNLKNHTRTHSGERPYRCDVVGCRKGFSELSSLKKHSLVHSGDKPFDCDLCGKSFSQIGSRNVHRRRHHGADASKSQTPTSSKRQTGALSRVDPFGKDPPTLQADEIEMTFVADESISDTLVVPISMDDDEVVIVDVRPESEIERTTNEMLSGVSCQHIQTETTILNDDCPPDDLILPDSHHHANVVVIAQPLPMAIFTTEITPL